MKDADMPALERTCNGALALHYAAARGCLDCVRLLVDASSDLSANTQMDNDVTPVYLAAQEGHLEVLKFLVLEAGGSLYVRAKDGMAPVHAASQMGCLNCLKWMVQDQGVDPNLRDGDGATPLHFAASRGHVEVVRWLLRHGAKLVLDKYGKSPINDAAENHQMECLNLLVQRGTTPDYHDDLRQGKLHGCTCRAGDNTVCSYADCVNYGRDKEPFYLHPPTQGSVKDSPPVKDGLYINPMTVTQTQSQTHSFYLHNPHEVPYHRVKDLFSPEKSGFATYSKPPPPPPPPPLTVKVEVHSSSSGAGSDENMSSSDLSERGSGSGAGGEHDYEDIYMVRAEAGAGKPRSRSRDSGSHSRSASLSSTHSNIIVEVETQPELPVPNSTNGSPKLQPAEINSDAQSQNSKTKLNHSHSMPYHAANSRALKRVVSEPGGALPPPPPPPPPEDLSLTSSPDLSITPTRTETLNKTHRSESQSSQSSADNSSMEEQTTLRASSVSPPKPDEPPILDSHDGTNKESGSGGEAPHAGAGPNLVNKQMVLPFIPPKFPSSGEDSDSLIKPSEYLRALGSKAPTLAPLALAPNAPRPEPLPAVHSGEDKTGSTVSVGPPPPPMPEPVTPPPPTRKADQPLGTISIQDLNSVQLRRTNKPLSKTMSAPLSSLTGPVEAPFQVAKQDLIEELKKSKDITGIKKMKVEKVKMEEQHEKEMVTEITKQLSVDSFVEKIPDKDATGNPIPPWKRQMLAKKAAEKARKEMEEMLARQAEEKRLQAIPAWKRQLMQAKKPDDKPTTNYITTTSVEEKRVVPAVQIVENSQARENKENNQPVAVHKEVVTPTTEDETGQIIPWRAQLRKTNSTLNLLE
ncbi:espin isoform X2 [Homalodisca vitripennis]|uniref:espin isoform X2 n=1 Tax=Homalodisca vitripennis TaxID=197043 RepID=UPI001EEB0B09|nr:espin isoform X2 [Homalodisca vitripennis]